MWICTKLNLKRVQKRNFENGLIIKQRVIYVCIYGVSTPSIGDNPNQLLQCIMSLSLLSFNSRGLYGKKKKMDFLR